MPESAFEYLNSHSLLFLATASSGGNVHVAPMFYATEGKGCSSRPPTARETAANLKQNPTAAFAVADPPADWGKARGLQVEGPVTELDGRRRGRGRRAVPGEVPAPRRRRPAHPLLAPRGRGRPLRPQRRGRQRAFESLGQTWTREKV